MTSVAVLTLTYETSRQPGAAAAVGDLVIILVDKEFLRQVLTFSREKLRPNPIPCPTEKLRKLQQPFLAVLASLHKRFDVSHGEAAAVIIEDAALFTPAIPGTTLTPFEEWMATLRAVVRDSVADNTVWESSGGDSCRNDGNDGAGGSCHEVVATMVVATMIQTQ